MKDVLQFFKDVNLLFKDFDILDIQFNFDKETYIIVLKGDVNNLKNIIEKNIIISDLNKIRVVNGDSLIIECIYSHNLYVSMNTINKFNL